MEALLATANHNGYEDGDIVEAFSLNRIRLAHAQSLTSVQYFPLDDVSGLRVVGTALDKLLAVTHKYKFTVDDGTVMRIDLGTSETTVLAGDYTAYINRRLTNSGHTIFGTSSVTHWYGEILDNIDANSVWDVLEDCTDYHRSDYSTWPVTELEQRFFLPVTMTGKSTTDDGVVDVLLSDPTVDEFRSSSATINYEDDIPIETVHARRRFNVPYWDLTDTFGVSADLARTQMTDARTFDNIPHIDACVVDKEA